MKDIDLVKLHRKAGEKAAEAIGNIREDQWREESNIQWSVKELVNHIVSENLWVPDLMEGKTIEEVGGKYSGDCLGENPLASYERSITLANEAISTPGALDRIVHLSYGDLLASVYIGHRLIDLVIHRWDILKSTGQPDELDQDLVEGVSEILKPQLKDMQQSGYFGTPVEVPEDASLQTKLLVSLGRERLNSYR